jgi:hypothetical protein
MIYRFLMANAGAYFAFPHYTQSQSAGRIGNLRAKYHHRKKGT